MMVRMDRMEKEVSTLKKHNNNLSARVKLLEENKLNNEEKNTKKFNRHQIKKRQIIKNNTSMTNKYCASAANLCTFFYPDHPDQIGKTKSNSGPSKVLISSGKNIETIIPPDLSSKVPENCQDLKSLGHTLDGFYLVQKGEEVTNKIGTVFCQFNQQQSSANEAIKRKILYDQIISFCIFNFFFNEAKERNIGLIQLKTRDVYFNVYNLRKFSGRNAILAFEEEVLNVGNAFNKMKGIFTAPVSGIYTFVLFVLRGVEKYDTNISFRINQLDVASTFAPGSLQSYSTMSIESTLKMAAGDQLDILFKTGSIRLAHSHFMGWLQQENNFIIEISGTK